MKTESNIPGLEELRKLQNERELYLYNLYKFQRSETGQEPTKPNVKYRDAAEQYPAADAYLKAEAYEMSVNPAKAAAGRWAKERIAKGEDYNMVLNDMIAEGKSPGQ